MILLVENRLEVINCAIRIAAIHEARLFQNRGEFGAGYWLVGGRRWRQWNPLANDFNLARDKTRFPFTYRDNPCKHL